MSNAFHLAVTCVVVCCISYVYVISLYATNSCHKFNLCHKWMWSTKSAGCTSRVGCNTNRKHIRFKCYAWIHCGNTINFFLNYIYNTHPHFISNYLIQNAKCRPTGSISTQQIQKDNKHTWIWNVRTPPFLTYTVSYVVSVFLVFLLSPILDFWTFRW